MRLRSLFTRSARSQSSWSQERRCLPVISRVMTERVVDKTLLPWCDVTIPPVSYCDYVWDNVHHHGHLPVLVCPVQDITLTHGQVGPTIRIKWNLVPETNQVLR